MADQTQTQIAYEYEGQISQAAEAGAADPFYQSNDEEQSLYIRIIKAGKSANTVTGYDYPASVLEQATPLFDGAHVYFNHPDPEELRRSHGIRRIEDKVGRIKQPRYNAPQQATEGRLHVFDPALYQRLKRGGDAYGISMHAEVIAPPPGSKPRPVSRIAKVNSVDIVDRPGAGGYISPAFEAALKEIVMADQVSTQAAEAAAPLTIADHVMPMLAAHGAALEAHGTALDAHDTAIKSILARLDALEASEKAEDATDVKGKGQNPGASTAKEAASADTEAKLQVAQAELASYKRQATITRLASELNTKKRLPAEALQLATESFQSAETDDAKLQAQLAAHLDRFARIAQPASSPQPRGMGESATTATESSVNRAVPQSSALTEFHTRMGYNTKKE